MPKMPIYEYECLDCGKKLEVMQKFNDSPLKTCSQCGGRLHKLISRTSFILKGNGWYVTDYARADKKKEAPSHAKPASLKEKSKSAAKTESKPKAEVTAKR
jgi:putative FmdB family regulatory protein